MKKKCIKPVFVNFIPDRLEEEVLYICKQYKTAIHKCCCGCGEEVVTPLSPVDWSFKKEGAVVSLTPSIGNWNFACKSHYYIHRNKIIWVSKFSQFQIDQAQELDRSDKKEYIEAINQQKNKKTNQTSWISKIWNSFIRWLNP